MAIQNVNNGESWAQFMRLVQEARSRTQSAPVSAVSPKAPVAKAAFTLPTAPASRAAEAAPIQRASIPGGPTRVLGNNFDVYA